MNVSRAIIRCRQIRGGDLPDVQRLLAEGFPTRDPAEWDRVLHRFASYRGPVRLPRYGFFLLADERPVGLVLMISSARWVDGVERHTCNLSSWYVEPAFRGYAPRLIRAATRDRSVTYVNVSPAPHTLRVVEALGFKAYNQGSFLCLPVLSRSAGRVRVEPAHARADALPGSSEHDRELVANHAALGCTAFWCVSDGRSYPFVFVRRQSVRGFLPCAQLVYCQNESDVVRCARAIGVQLLRRGMAALAIDAPGPVSGLTGWYRPDQCRRYFRGPFRPRLGDIAFSEATLFGLAGKHSA